MSELNRMLSFCLVAIAVLILLIACLLWTINRRKGIFGLVLGILFLALAGYYVYVAFIPVPGGLEPGTRLWPFASGSGGPPPGPLVVLDIDGHPMKVPCDGEVEISKRAVFKIVGVEGVSSGEAAESRVNIVGFVGNPRRNDGQDIGYPVSYERMNRRHSVGRDSFRMEVKQGDESLGTVMIRFVD